MKIYKFNELTQAKRGAVVAIGFFDGVHLGHRYLISEAKAEAKKIGAPLGIFTFLSESGIKSDKKRLYSTEEKLRLIGEYEPDFAVVVDFEDVRALSAEEFVRSVLIDRLCAEVAVVGRNFRFGSGASADAEQLTRLMRAHGKSARIVEEKQTDDGTTISSSLIRSLIERGKIEDANRLLKRCYRCRGKVLSGIGKGHELGFPTINSEISGVIPRLGVYRTAVLIDENVYDAVTNVGTCPTISEREVHMETHVIGYSKNAYGKEIEIYFFEFLRDEATFRNEEELIKQIKLDIITTKERNGEEKWQELGRN